VTTGPAHGFLTGTAPNLTYTPNLGYLGPDYFQFTVTNTGGITSSAASNTLLVHKVPTANPQTVAVVIDTPTDITLTGSDPNVPALPLSYGGFTVPAHGSLSGMGQKLTYTPNMGYVGLDSFQFQVFNNAMAGSKPATVTLIVGGTIGDVTGQISVSKGPFLYQRATGTYNVVLTLTNTGRSSVIGPVSCILTGLTNAALANASGTTSTLLPAGRPFKDAGAGNLAPGANVNVTLSFTKSGTGTITYAVQIVSGPGSR
jgi:hypothetical protein